MSSLSPLASVVASMLLTGCIVCVDFDYDGPSGGAGGGGSTANVGGTPAGGAPAGGGGAGAEGGSGGQGGADPCAGLDLTTDHDNCGTCRFMCDAEACVGGKCGAALDLSAYGLELGSVVVDGDYVFVIQRLAAAPNQTGNILTFPLDFTSDMAPLYTHPVENVVGSLALGTIGAKHVYYTGQLTKKIYACEPLDCFDRDISSAITSQLGYLMAPANDEIYAVADGRSLVSFPIDPVSGIPSSDTTVLVSAHEPPFSPGDGILEAHYLESEGRVIWGRIEYEAPTDGCVYSELVSDLPLMPLGTPAQCWSPTYASAGEVVAADGTVYGQDGWVLNPINFKMWKISGSPPTLVEFATNVESPHAIDDGYLYTTDHTTKAIRRLTLGTGVEVGGPPVTPAPPAAIDAHSSRYLVYTAGTVLYRWPKP